MIDRARLLPAAWWVMFLAGCQAAGPTQRPADTPAGPQDSPAPVVSATLWPSHTLTGTLEETVGDAPPVTLGWMARPGPGGHITTYIAGRYIGYYRIAPDGGVELIQEDDLQERATVVYDPPLKVLPPTLSHETVPWRHEVRITVINPKTGAVRQQGGCAYTIHTFAPRPADNRAGSVETVVIDSGRVLTFPMARVTLGAHAVWAPGRGRISGRLEQRRVVLAIPTAKAPIERVRVSENRSRP